MRFRTGGGDELRNLSFEVKVGVGLGVIRRGVEGVCV